MDTHGMTQIECDTMRAIQNISQNQLTLREFFAGMALCGMMAKGREIAEMNDLPKAAWYMADKMIENKNHKFKEEE